MSVVMLQVLCYRVLPRAALTQGFRQKASIKISLLSLLSLLSLSLSLSLSRSLKKLACTCQTQHTYALILFVDRADNYDIDTEILARIAGPPPTVQTFCSVVVWSIPRFPCDDIIGSEVRLYDPESGKEVSHSVDSYSTYYIIKDEDEVKIELEKAYVQVRIFCTPRHWIYYSSNLQCKLIIQQVRVLHKLLGARKWSDGIPLGKRMVCCFE